MNGDEGVGSWGALGTRPGPRFPHIGYYGEKLAIDVLVFYHWRSSYVRNGAIVNEF